MTGLNIVPQNKKMDFVSKQDTIEPKKPKKKYNYKYKPGQPSKYRHHYPEKLIEHFSKCEPYETIIQTDGSKKLQINDMPLFETFENELFVDHDTLNNWADAHPEFLAAMTFARNRQKYFMATNGQKGYYHAGFTAFLSKNMVGWRDNKDLNIGGQPGNPVETHLQVTFVKPDEQATPAVKATFK
jgi:hypothetical protein